MSMKFTIIEPCNYLDFPVGGQLSFTRQLIQCHTPEEVSLVGLTCDPTLPVGCWTVLCVEGRKFRFFPVEYRRQSSKRPFLPGRLTFLLGILRWRRRMLEQSGRNFFIQAPEAMLGVRGFRGMNLCYCFPGVENPLSMPRYWWGKLFQKPFYRLFLDIVLKSRTVLASADQAAIDDLKQRNPRLRLLDIIKFPTCVDTGKIRPATPQEKLTLRRELRLPLEKNIIVFCGRLNRVKGWQLLIESFAVVNRRAPATALLIVGDGEDRVMLQHVVDVRGLNNNVILTGFVEKSLAVEYLRAADLFAVCSLKEGWSLAMLDALAAGLPMVSTPVSGAFDMIHGGDNGLVVKDRDPVRYAESVLQVLDWPEAGAKSAQLADLYALKHLRRRLDDVWKRAPD